MIVKRIPGRGSGRNAITERAMHARLLVDYIRSPEKVSEEQDRLAAYMLSEKLGGAKGERLYHVGGRGFVSTSLDAQRAEMIAVAHSARRSANPIDHWLLSWQQGERPTPEQVDGAVDIFLEHLGVASQPCIYACHGDTDNRHVHMAINRYDPVAGRMIEINDGWNREAAHEAVALILDRFGWQREAGARYEVKDGELVPTEGGAERLSALRQGTGGKRPGNKAAAFENRTGYRSAQAIAQAEALPLIKEAKCWGDLHAKLAEVGITYDLKGTNGAIITVSGDPVKAYNVDRSVTRSRLERRLGTFEARNTAMSVASRDPAADRLAEAFRADEYREELARWRQWQGDRREARLARATIALGKQAASSAPSLKQAKPPKPARDLETWLRARNESIFADRWRFRRRVVPFPNLTGQQREGMGRPEEIDGYVPYVCSDGVRYARGADGPTAFVDRGTRVDVVVDDEAALLAALRLAVKKFDGAVTVKGSPEFRQRIQAIAEANGLAQALSDPDLRRRRDVEKAPELKPGTTTSYHAVAEPATRETSMAGDKATTREDSREAYTSSTRQALRDFVAARSADRPQHNRRKATAEQDEGRALPAERPPQPPTEAAHVDEAEAGCAPVSPQSRPHTPQPPPKEKPHARARSVGPGALPDPASTEDDMDLITAVHLLNRDGGRG